MGTDSSRSALFSHQEFCLDLASRENKYLFACDTGTGKTRLGLEIIEKNYTGTDKIFVVAPLMIVDLAWVHDHKKFGFEYPMENGCKKHEKWADKKIVHVINYEQARIHWEKIRALKPKVIIFDESVKLKNPTAKLTKNMLKLSRDCQKVYLLSGCPAPNSPLEYYPQVKMVDDAGLMPDSFYAFRNEYFTKPKPDLHWLWVPKHKDVESDIMKRIKTKATFIKKSECLDLPEQIFVTREVIMGDPEMALYQKMKEEFIVELEKNEFVVAGNVLSQLVRLREITSGQLDGKEIGESKIKALEEILEEIGSNQVLVFGQFRKELERYQRKFGGALLYGNLSDSDREDAATGFINGKHQYLFAHPQSSRFGLTFVNARYCVWASQSFNYDEWYQGNQRIHRIGQKHNTTHISLLCKDTIEPKIHEVVCNKGEANKALLDIIKMERKD